MPRWEMAFMIALVLGAIGLAGYNAKGSYLYDVMSGQCWSKSAPPICDQSFFRGRLGYGMAR